MTVLVGGDARDGLVWAPGVGIGVGAAGGARTGSRRSQQVHPGSGARRRDRRPDEGWGHRGPRPTVVPGLAERRLVRPAACRVARPAVRWPVLVAVGVAVAAVLVFAGGVIANMVGGMAAQVPRTTAVVAVAPGETLWDVARRYAPESDPHAVVSRIEELNGVNAGGVSGGATLVVPAQSESAARG